MSKYNLDTKLQIVADYIAGEGGYKRLEKKYQIDVSNIKSWIHNFQDFGLLMSTEKWTTLLLKNGPFGWLFIN